MWFQSAAGRFKSSERSFWPRQSTGCVDHASAARPDADTTQRGDAAVPAETPWTADDTGARAGAEAPHNRTQTRGPQGLIPDVLVYLLQQ